ncbi:MAG: 2Fe-2S iron-sulfur cluster-binding protein, partial [Pseudomonadota bacterium]
MTNRIDAGGRLIDRTRTIGFSFNGETLNGHPGDTLASALLANGKKMVGRSFKYHRPRGVVASGAEEPNALMGLGAGASFEPNQRATTTELFDGLQASSQNHWPSLEFDVGAVNAAVAGVVPVFSAGFYYKSFMYPRAAWKHVYEPFIRQAAGLGQAPKEADADTYEHFHVHTDILVVGGGMAGIAAARTAAASGARVLLVEQTKAWGGRALVDDVTIDGLSGPDWVAREIAELEAMANVTLRTRCMGAGMYDHGYAMLYERVGDHDPAPGAPRHRLWRVRTKQIVVASGAIERPLTFATNDVPGVMLASAVRDYVELYGVAPGSSAVIAANNDDAYRTAIALDRAGVVVRAVLDVRSEANGPLPQQVRELGIPVKTRHGISAVKGKKSVEAIEYGRISASGRMTGKAEKIFCDVVAMSGGWSPVVHLFSHCGGKLR